MLILGIVGTKNLHFVRVHGISDWLKKSFVFLSTRILMTWVLVFSSSYRSVAVTTNRVSFHWSVVQVWSYDRGKAWRYIARFIHKTGVEFPIRRTDYTFLISFCFWSLETSSAIVKFSFFTENLLFSWQFRWNTALPNPLWILSCI